MLFDTDETTSLAGNLDCDTSSNNGCSLLRHHKVKVPGIDLIGIFLRGVKTHLFFENYIELTLKIMIFSV